MAEVVLLNVLWIGFSTSPFLYLLINIPASKKVSKNDSVGPAVEKEVDSGQIPALLSRPNNRIFH